MWQWGRRGAGPKLAVDMARGLGNVPGVESLLCLSEGAEILGLAHPPRNDLPIRTYRSLPGFAGRLLSVPAAALPLARRIRASGVDAALCAMPAPLDVLMAAALRLAGVPFAVVVHDAQLHPGDVFPWQMPLQRAVMRRAGGLFALSGHVAAQLRTRGVSQDISLIGHPPFTFDPPPPPVGAHGGPVRLLSFGRLLPYKGLDLLAAAMALLPNPAAFELRVVGAGPESPDLDRLRALPHTAVENRWVPEAEMGALIGWADAVLLTHREASQSGLAAAAAGRWVVSTRVGGLAEQLATEPMAILCDVDAAAIAAAVAGLLGRPVPPPSPVPTWQDSAETVAAGLRTLLRTPAARA